MLLWALLHEAPPRVQVPRVRETDSGWLPVSEKVPGPAQVPGPVQVPGQEREKERVPGPVPVARKASAQAQAQVPGPVLERVPEPAEGASKFGLVPNRKWPTRGRGPKLLWARKI
jgi:hypothetical protein